MKDKTNETARAALSELQDGLDGAKKLVERTRSLLSGEIAYDEGEMGMIVAQAQAQQPPIGEPAGDAAVDPSAESP